MDKIKWGIIGPGRIAKQFAHDFQFTQHATLQAIASTNRERAEAFARDYNVPKIYTSYQELCNDPEIDAIYIATPHVFHLENSLMALKSGKAVLCEKPLTENLEKTEKLISAARKYNTYLAEGMWTYFLPAIQQAQKWVKDGRIGKILHLKADFGFAFPYDAKNRKFAPELGGGAILDMGIYPIALAYLFLQKPPAKMNIIDHKAPTGVDDDVTLLYNYGEEVATLHTSFRSKLHNHAFIVGEKGYISIPDFWRASECYLYNNETRIDYFSDDRKSNGFNFEIDTVSIELKEQKKESTIMPHKNTLAFANQMDQILKRI